MAVAALLLTGCASGSSGDDEKATEKGPQVNWSKYPSSQKRLIDNAARDGKCRLLQATFDTQAGKDGADPDLLDYIDQKLRSANCY